MKSTLGIVLSKSSVDVSQSLLFTRTFQDGIGGRKSRSSTKSAFSSTGRSLRRTILFSVEKFNMLVETRAGSVKSGSNGLACLGAHTIVLAELILVLGLVVTATLTVNSLGHFHETKFHLLCFLGLSTFLSRTSDGFLGLFPLGAINKVVEAGLGSDILPHVREGAAISGSDRRDNDTLASSRLGLGVVLGDIEGLTGETSGKIAFLSSENSKIYLSKGSSGVSVGKVENSSGEVENPKGENCGQCLP